MSITKVALGMAIWVLFVQTVSAQGVGIDLDDLDIDIDGDNMQINSDDIDLDIHGDDIQMRSDDVDIDVSGNDVRIDTGDTDIDVSDRGTSVSSGQQRGDVVQINTTNGGNAVAVSNDNLSLQISGGSVSVETAKMLLEIDKDDDVLIQTDEDVTAFARIVVDSNPSVVKAAVSGDSVSVAYVDRGRFLGIVPMSFEASVVVGVDGTVVIERPWYSYLMFGARGGVISSSVSARIAGEAFSTTNVSLKKAQAVDIVADEVRLQTSASGNVSIETPDASIEVDGEDVSIQAEGTSVETSGNGNGDIEIRGEDGEYLRIRNGAIDISL